MKKKRTILFRIILLSLAAVLAGCGSSTSIVPASSTGANANGIQATTLSSSARLDAEKTGPSAAEVSVTKQAYFTTESRIWDVIEDPDFDGFGRLIFPADQSIDRQWALSEVDRILPYYNGIQPQRTVDIVNEMKNDAAAGEQIFYDIYTDEEKAADPAKKNTGLFFFRGTPGGKFAIVNAGGAFTYVGAMHDSFPHAMELSEKGYQAFALIYRPGAQTACEDLARAIAFVHDHAAELEVDTSDYSLWGGSAGARMAAWLGSNGTAAYGEAAYPKPAAVVLQYTGLTGTDGNEPPTYACVGTSDAIAGAQTMETRIRQIQASGTPAEIEIFEGLPHGFGLGEGTIAEGWLNRAVAFWEKQMTTPAATAKETSQEGRTAHPVPTELTKIPQSYYAAAEKQGTLVELSYNTWESKTYAQKSKPLTKRAIVYLPYGYNEEQKYNVLYLMHGGWSNETSSLGTPAQPNAFKHVIDHAIADGTVEPQIIVCPTYNNESPEDSGDYTLAFYTLTVNYHNELVNDLIPAVEGTWSTHAESTTPEDIRRSRAHRAFSGFSMGSVTTWYTFVNCLDEFRYFLPMSGAMDYEGDDVDAAVTASGHKPEDFFIYAFTGTEDFEYGHFTRQIEGMLGMPSGNFRLTDRESDGNLAFHVEEGYAHDGRAAMEYIYNGLMWLWR